MLAPVERHVLDQMCQPELVVGLEERSGFDREPQRDAFGRPAVLADEVLQAVRQRRRANGGIERHRVLEVDGLGAEADECQHRRGHDEE